MNICQDTVLTRQKVVFWPFFCTWWPLKVGQGHPCSNSSETLLICVYLPNFEVCAMNICQDTVLTRQKVVVLTFLLHLMTPKSRSSSPMFELEWDFVNMCLLTKFEVCAMNICQNTVLTRQKVVFWPFFCTWWPLKVGQGHPCSNSSETLLTCVYSPNLVPLRWVWVIALTRKCDGRTYGRTDGEHFHVPRFAGIPEIVLFSSTKAFF